ncbi:MAG: hypothetical protein ACJ8G7_16270, partial [Rhizobacter sp.]
MKPLTVALVAGGVLVSSAGAFSLRPAWFMGDDKVAAANVAPSWLKHDKPAATRVAAAESTAVPAAPVQQTYAPNYRAIVRQAGPAVVGVSVAGLHAVTAEEQGG